MYLRLTGVLRDGSPLGAQVPANSAAALQFPAGASVTLEMTVETNAGTPVDLTKSGLSVVLTVKQSTQQGRSITPGFQKTATLPANAAPHARKNVVLIQVVPNDTKSLAPGRWVYDVWLLDASQSPAARNPLIPLSPLLLAPAVTLP